MSSNWSGYRGKRFDFSFFKGGGRTEYLVAAVLGVVIIGAAYMTIKQFFGDSMGDVPDKITYKCEKCGYEFSKKVKDMPQARTAGEQLDQIRVDCPSCKAPKACWQAKECPNCHKFFIAESMRAIFANLSSARGGPPNDKPDVCPYCHTNLVDWWKAHHK